MNENTTGLFGRGLYTFSESARLVGIPSNKVSCVLQGYRVGASGEYRREGKLYKPLWSKNAVSENIKFVSFKDLIELRFLKKFQLAGLSSQKLKKIRDFLVKEFDEQYPFSSIRLRTDGAKIFSQEEIKSELKTIEIFSGQENFTEIVDKSFVNLDYEDGSPKKWWFNGREKEIVLDPERAFGQPIDDKTGVPTAAIYNYVMANNSDYEQAARDFSLPLDTVKRACDFESSIAA